MILYGNTLYGTAVGGGSSGNGTLFAVNTNGTGFTNLHSFAAGSGSFPNFTNSDGASMWGGLILSGNALYGTAQQGSSSGAGTIFSLSFPLPRLTMAPSGTDLILTWPASVPGFSYAGFTLQSTTNLASRVIWSTNSPAPLVVNGHNTVTNPVSGPQKFYRLSQ